MKIKFLVKLLCINGTLLIAMLLCLDVLRAFLRDDIATSRKISAIYHHGLIPGGEFSHEWVQGDRIIEKTNAFGFRFTKSDHEVKSLNEYRTVVIGDSFTEGVGLRYEQVFASLLPPQFNPVANMGVISYSPFIYHKKLRHFKGNGLNPKYLIQIIDVSDVQDEYHYRREGFVSMPMPSFIEDTRLAKTFTYRLLLKAIWRINSKEPFTTTEKKRKWFDRYYKTRDPYTLPNEPSYYQEGKVSLMSEIERSVKLFPEASHYVIAYNWGPHRMTESGKILYAKYIEDLKSMTKKYSNSTFCDMTDVVEVPNGYIKGDVHWNHLGNQQISKKFYRDCFGKVSSWSD